MAEEMAGTRHEEEKQRVFSSIFSFVFHGQDQQETSELAAEESARRLPDMQAALGLIDSGAVIDGKDADGNAAMMLAAQQGYAQIGDMHKKQAHETMDEEVARLENQIAASVENSAELQDRLNRDFFPDGARAHIRAMLDRALETVFGKRREETEHVRHMREAAEEAKMLDEQRNYYNRLSELRRKTETQAREKKGHHGLLEDIGESLAMPAIHGDVATVRQMIEAGADINEKTRGGNNLLILAAYKGQADVVRLLTANKAQLDEKTKGGRTALMHAARKGRKDVVCALIDAGASLHEKDRHGRCALDYAVRCKHTEIETLLREAHKKQEPVRNQAGKDFAEAAPRSSGPEQTPSSGPSAQGNKKPGAPAFSL